MAGPGKKRSGGLACRTRGRGRKGGVGLGRGGNAAGNDGAQNARTKSCTRLEEKGEWKWWRREKGRPKAQGKHFFKLGAGRGGLAGGMSFPRGTKGAPASLIAMGKKRNHVPLP